MAGLMTMKLAEAKQNENPAAIPRHQSLEMMYFPLVKHRFCSLRDFKPCLQKKVLNGSDLIPGSPGTGPLNRGRNSVLDHFFLVFFADLSTLTFFGLSSGFLGIEILNTPLSCSALILPASTL